MAIGSMSMVMLGSLTIIFWNLAAEKRTLRSKADVGKVLARSPAIYLKDVRGVEVTTLLHSNL